MTDISHALDTRPLLGEIARMWRQIAPHDLTTPEILSVLAVLTAVTDRLSEGK